MLKKFADENSNGISYIAPQINGSSIVKVGNKSRSTTLNGTSPEYENIKNMHVQSGRYLLSFDMDYMQKVAVIGTAVANDVFEGEDPVGKTMKIDGQIFKVVGLLEQKADGQDQSDDDQVIIPVTVAQRLSRNTIIRSFSVQASNPEIVNSVMDELSD